MRRFERGPCPDFLRDNWIRWGQKYATNRGRKPSFKLLWYVVPNSGRVKANIRLLPLLEQLTNSHCSYCDDCFLADREKSIDHFQPKSDPAYYQIAYQWENLYFSCPNCQSRKGEQYNDLLLRPDDILYDFDTYFEYDFIDHQINPNPNANINNRERARESIRIYGLNDKSASRKFIKRSFDNDPEPLVEEYPFRFMFD